MPKQKLKKWLPSPSDLQKNRALGFLAPYITHPKLWYLNRHSLTRGIYVGVIAAFFPLPGQMILAALLSLIFRANIPMAMALTWLTNPVTTIPVFYGAYLLGAWLLGEPFVSIRLIARMLADSALWVVADGASPLDTYHGVLSFKAFFVGTALCAVICSALLGVLFKLFWRYKVGKTWRARHLDKTPS